MPDVRQSLAKRFAILAIVSAVILISLAPLSQSTYEPQVFQTGNYGTNHDTLASFASSAVAQRAPAKEEKVLVLRAALLGSPFDVDNNKMRSMLTNDLKSYYLEASYSEVSMNTTYVNKNYTMPQGEAYYGEGTEVELHVIEMVQSTITLAEADVNASGGYKIFRHIIIVHSGLDQAATHQGLDITSQFIYREGSELFTLPDGVKIMNACVVSESDPLGVVVHELGHSLGLPDLYNYATSETGDTFMGEWDLMATGSWNPGGQGTSPSHPTTWCKFTKLGWIKTTEVADYNQTWIANGHNATVLLNPQEKQNLTLAIKILLNNGTYYLIESRMKTGYDGALPNNGVLVIFCDDSKGSGQGPAVLMSAHPPSLGSDAAFNVGWFTQSFYGDKLRDIGIKVLNKWSNGTFKVFIGNYNAALSVPTEYQDNFMPVVALVGGGAIFVIVAVVIYLKKGRQKTSQVGYDSIPVIKLS